MAPTKSIVGFFIIAKLNFTLTASNSLTINSCRKRHLQRVLWGGFIIVKLNFTLTPMPAVLNAWTLSCQDWAMQTFPLQSFSSTYGYHESLHAPGCFLRMAKGPSMFARIWAIAVNFGQCNVCVGRMNATMISSLVPLLKIPRMLEQVVCRMGF